MVSGEFVAVSPFVAPTTKVYVSNVPPFISINEIERGLSCYGMFASTIKELPFGCKNKALKHVMSLRRQVFMFLEESNLVLNLESFRVLHEGKAYMIYANTGRMKCYECGDVGHKKLACPHKVGTSGDNARPSIAAVVANESEDGLPPVVEEEHDAHNVEQAEVLITIKMGKLLLNQKCENYVMNDDLSIQVGIYGEVAVANIDTSNGEEVCDAEMKDDDMLSSISDMGSQIVRDE